VGPQASHWLHDLTILEPNLSTYFIIFDPSKGQIVQIQTSHASHVLYQISLWVPTIPLRIKCPGLPWLSCIHGQVLSILKKVLSSAFIFFQFCDVAKLAMTKKKYLSKFGYIPDMKLKKENDNSIFLATY
jgi:hypothetical protein